MICRERALMCDISLAADRVYLLRQSPGAAAGSYPAHFTLSSSFRDAVVSFLWHFP